MTDGPSNNKTIKVRLRKGGWEVEITCAEDQLKHAIESVLSSLGGQNEPAEGLKEELTSGQGNKTCRGLIVELWRDSWFNRSRSLGEVHEEIGRRGYHYDRTAVSHALRDLVLENILTREGSSRSYLYIQKRPSDAAVAIASEEVVEREEEEAEGG